VSEQKSVLIADNERVLRSLIRATLRKTDVRVLEATSGTEALAVARQEHPHVLLLDVGLPGLDGYAVCRALKKDPQTADIRVVMLTARAQRADRERGAEAGADSYITKPFSTDELREQVQRLL
jgi:two-component system alkaline phosphatase synthesis response regulator PhoP